ncbi:MAG TPA: DNA-formamidopyrimidine glycosylase family protein [Actinomycetota bacterium]|nr:DNA-formamidopyrimidine glycosylase family protein [Actinomycetota bacterium]
MPEGDTVFRAARSMHKALAGRMLTSTDFRVPQYATADLTGQIVTEVVPRGKHMLTRTDDGVTLHTHFKMEGSWHLYKPGTKWGGGPAHEVRVVLQNAEWSAVGYRLPIVQLLPTSDEDQAVGHLGPDLLGPDWDLDAAVTRLLDKPDTSIAEALLDQRNLAGIGNLYKAETLFLRGVHPWTPVAAVRDLPALVALAQKLLKANTRHWAQATTGNTARGQRHWVFERAGQPCRRCGTPILSAMQGDPAVERITYWCPACQPK